MEYLLVLTLRVKVGLGVMVMKEYSTFSRIRASRIRASPPNVIFRTLVEGVLSLCRNADWTEKRFLKHVTKYIYIYMICLTTECDMGTHVPKKTKTEDNYNRVSLLFLLLPSWHHLQIFYHGEFCFRKEHLTYTKPIIWLRTFFFKKGTLQ